MSARGASDEDDPATGFGGLMTRYVDGLTKLAAAVMTSADTPTAMRDAVRAATADQHVFVIVSGSASKEVDVVDLFRPAAMALVEIDVRPVRVGRRVTVTDAWMRCDGHDVGRATAVFLAESEEPPGRIWRPPYEPWPEPDSIKMSEAGSPDHAGWWFRRVRGGFGTG